MSCTQEGSSDNCSGLQRHLLVKGRHKRRLSRGKYVTEKEKKEYNGQTERREKDKSKPIEKTPGLFVDNSFPPDKSSLTYVYSGDDNYDAMAFKRPTDLVPYPVLVGHGGKSQVLPPSGRWCSGRAWFQYAVSVVALNHNHVNKLIPNAKLFAQSFQEKYTGAFRLSLWRFGEWIDVIIDDFLPVLDDRLAYCPCYGDPPEFWPSLLEKAYAKCHKAYEAVEVGNPLNALVDLTGGICENYLLENHFTDDFFNIIYKSCANRSMVVCWRNTKSFKQPGFKNKSQKNSEKIHGTEIAWSENSPQDFGPNYLYVITAATKFPLRDGRLVEMLRIRNPYDSHATWTGDFSHEKLTSWNSVNPTFMENYKPRDCVHESEFWMTYQDFLGHFSDLVICSSCEPFDCSQRDNQGFFDSSDAPQSYNELSKSCSDLNDARKSERNQTAGFLDVPNQMAPRRKHSLGITVQESLETVKIDTVTDTKSFKSTADIIDSKQSSRLTLRRFSARDEEVPFSNLGDRTRHSNSFRQTRSQVVLQRDTSNQPATRQANSCIKGLNHKGNPKARPFDRAGSIQSRESGHSTYSLQSSQSGVTDLGVGDLTHHDSIASNLSGLSCSSISSDHDSLYSASEIMIKVNGCNQPRKQRINSAPFLSRDSPSSFLRAQTAAIFEAPMDYFRSRGAWQEIVKQFGKWTKETSGGPLTNMKQHSKNPRILFVLTKSDTICEITPSSLRGKGHVIISVMQDYRQGSLTSNSMPVSIGFALYKSKYTHPEKTEKRSLAKLTLMADVASEREARHLTARFDLDPGHYVIVPYTATTGFEGDFLVRVFGEKDKIPGGSGCVIS